MSKESPRPYIGGQAVIEGVMMRSPGSMAIVCRRASVASITIGGPGNNPGALVVREQPMAVPTKTGPRSWPLLRGVMTLVEALKLGHGAMMWAVEHFAEDHPDPEEAKQVDKPEAQATNGGRMVTIISIVAALGIFVALPQTGAEGISRLFNLGLEVTSPGYQVLTGIAKLIIVVSYMLLLRRTEIGKRVFQYHGAEHKTITTYEAGEELVVDNARPKTTKHPRCGTTFIVMVALVSILVFSAIGAFLPTLPGGRLAQSVGFFLMKLPFLPLVAGITYEIQRVFARYCTTGPLRALLWPGFLVQMITTAEPDDQQLEVALASLRATLWREEALTAPTPEDRTFSDYGELIATPGYAGASSMVSAVSLGLLAMMMHEPDTSPAGEGG